MGTENSTLLARHDIELSASRRWPTRTVTSIGRAVAAHVLDAEADRLLLADDAEARRLLDHDAAVALVLAAGEERMQRAADASLRRVCRNVVDLAVGDHHGAGKALRRDFGERPVERLEERGCRRLRR